MNQKVALILFLVVLMIGGCTVGEEKKETIELSVFAAKSLNRVMEELYLAYQEEEDGVEFLSNYDSSGTLMTQIEEGADCDIFFSAAMKQMDVLEEKGRLMKGTRENLLNNQVCLVTYKGSKTKVRELSDLSQAQNIALADESVPVGKYTRQALVNMGILESVEDVSLIPTEKVSEAFGGVAINECANVGVVVTAVAEGANEVGTVYYSDLIGHEEELEILQKLPYELTGDVIYPVAGIQKEKRAKEKEEAIKSFLAFLKTEKAKQIFEANYFDMDR